ncbi:MAG: hypothetical protein K2J99_14860 [Lachnospiraceae bacterium]|nr:hypothetical protein [Lachnospiraceae bacterium]
MKRKNKIYLRMTILLLIVYIGLLTILCLSEHTDSTATIRSFSDAFWYSLVTLTTVGYGDLTPVTPLGHAVGAVFLLLSAGIMMTLFGAVISFVTSEGLPFFLLGFHRKKNWYYFADYGVESSTLAKNIYKEDPDTVIIFGEKRTDLMEFPDYPCLFLNASPARIVAHKKNIGTKCKIFLMKENDIGINIRADNLHTLPVEVYARTTNGRDSLSGNIKFFHSYDCCARQYWRSNPLCSYENTIVIIGFGNYGRCILERAILTNIISVDQHVAYHIFGDAKIFLAMHSHLHEVFSLGEESKTTDSLIFHDELWEVHSALMEWADRIIICPDDETEGWNIFWRLNSYYKIQGHIHLRSSHKAPGVSYFGTNEEIYTPNQIMRTTLNKAAITINELFRSSVSYPTLSWEELDSIHRESKISAADHILMKIRILLKDDTITEFTPDSIEKAYKEYSENKKSEHMQDMYRRLDHSRWMRFYIFYNWSYGAVKDDAARQHPMLCPYQDLTTEQKRERDAAWELLGYLATESLT